MDAIQVLFPHRGTRVSNKWAYEVLEGVMVVIVVVSAADDASVGFKKLGGGGHSDHSLGTRDKSTGFKPALNTQKRATQTNPKIAADDVHQHQHQRVVRNCPGRARCSYLYEVGFIGSTAGRHYFK